MIHGHTLICSFGYVKGQLLLDANDAADITQAEHQSQGSPLPNQIGTVSKMQVEVSVFSPVVLIQIILYSPPQL